MMRTVLAAMRTAQIASEEVKTADSTRTLLQAFLGDERVEKAMADALHALERRGEAEGIRLRCDTDHQPCLRLAKKLLDEVWWA